MEAKARTWPGRLRRSPHLFPLAVVAALVLLTLSELSYWRAVHVVDEVRQRADVSAEVQTVLQGMSEAESGEWGYWLTGRPPDPTQARERRKGIEAALAALSRFAAASPPLRATVSSLEQQVQAQFDTWRGSAPGSRPATPSMQRMAAIRHLSMQIVAHQSQAATALRAELLDGLLLLRLGVAALLAVTLLAVAMSRRHAAALARQRDEQRRAVQAEREQLERLVQQRTEELTELSRHLEWAAEAARDRLAGALHDDFGALLTAAKLDAARLRARLPTGDEAAAARLSHLVELVDQAIALERRLIEDLRPSALQHLGLVPALEALVADFSRHSGLTVQAALAPAALAPKVALTAYRLVQEALDNVQQHAAARTVAVRLLPAGSSSVLLEVEDDGQGFDPARQHAVSHGLVGLRYRVQGVGGQWRLRSAAGQGTCVGALLPTLATAPVAVGRHGPAFARCEVPPTSGHAAG